MSSRANGAPGLGHSVTTTSDRNVAFSTSDELRPIKTESSSTPVRGISVISEGDPKRNMSRASSKASSSEKAKQRLAANQNKKQEPMYVKVSRIVVENKYFVGFTTLLTMYALTGDDIRLICTDLPADVIFNIMVVVCIVVFTIEVVTSCLGKDDYFMGFFFILDVASTATLVLDLTFVADELSGGGEDDDQAKNARAGRTARIGAKAGRVVRVIRLVRILKLYKAIYEAKQKQNGEESKAPGEEDDWDDVDIEKGEEEPTSQTESRVGKKLSEMTTRRVIILVLIMLLVLPQLRPEQADQLAVSAFYGADHVWETFVTSLDHGNQSTAHEDYERSMLQYLFYHNWFAGKGYCSEGNDCAGEYYSHVFWVGITGEDLSEVSAKASRAQLRASTVATWDTEVRAQKDIYNYGWMPDKVQQLLSSPWTQRCDTAQKKRLGLSLLSEEIDGVVGYTAKCPEDLRLNERKKYWARMQTFEEYDVWYFTFYFDLRLFSRMDAAFNLCITFFVCLVLCVASMYFSSDANNLVLKPVENMIKRVEAIRENPLIAMKMADEEFKAEEVAKAKQKKLAKERMSQMAKDAYRCQSFRKKTQEPMETVILEKTIIKLGSLLALGFGEAGANIIGDNMKGADSAGVNAMVPGVRVECIIGIVRIRDFSTATEVLQAKIMTFVNQIAEIVHGVVDEYHGAANKNNGDMFLIIWRLESMDNLKKRRMAEMSIVAMSKILGSLHSSALLASYREHPGLQQRLGSDCRVNLNIGLHCGWAIEGAVGSEFKIDASYLSPNVSIAISIERSTQMYGVAFILAQTIIELCGEEMMEKCRLMDMVVITGSTAPIKLYAVDLDYLSLDVDRSFARTFVWNTRQRYRARQFLESEKNLKLTPEVEIVTFFETDPVIKDMRRAYTEEFFQLFNMGYQNYAQGEWAVARRMLGGTLKMLQFQDGPSYALLRFMETFGFQSPKSWVGVRELDRHVTDII